MILRDSEFNRATYAHYPRVSTQCLAASSPLRMWNQGLQSHDTQDVQHARYRLPGMSEIDIQLCSEA